MDRLGVDSEFFGRVYEKKHRYKNRFEEWLTDIQPTLTSPYERLIKSIGNIKDKRICEIGCGNGYLTSLMIHNGALVEASDISIDAIIKAKILNQDSLGKEVNFRVMDAKKLVYESEHFDFVVGCGILHHVNLELVTKEINRVLKYGGKAIFDEPLAHNPVANIWRKMTPSTKDINEHPISYGEIKKMSESFKEVKWQEYNLLPMFSSIVYLITNSNKLKDKSAEKLGRIEPRFLKVFKPLKRYCGSILIEFTKAESIWD